MKNRIFIGIFALLAWASVVQADPDLSYTNWPAAQEWTALTNDIQRAYDAYKARYRAFWSSSSTLAPTFVHPYDDYKQLADAIDALSVWYVDVTKADQGGSFESYLEETNNYYIPYFTATGLHASAGFSSWASPQPLKVWQCFDRNIQSQVWACLNLMVCTEKGAYFTNAGQANRRYAYAQDWTNIPREDIVQDLQTDWDGETNTLYSASAIQHYSKIAKGALYWQASAERSAFKVYATAIWTGMPHLVDFYSYGASLLSGNAIFDAQGQNISTNPQLLSTVDFCTNYTVTSTETLCNASFSTMPSVHESSTEYYGFKLNDYDLDAIIWWDFPALPYPTIFPAPQELDTDCDDVVDVAGDVMSFGPDCGSISWLPEQDQAHVLLPLAATPSWAGILPVHAYISQGATTNLPFQYLLQGLTDDDGCYQAYSLNTRILESGAVTSPSHLKQVALRRPRGNIVIFDFPWDEQEQQFSAIGYPSGINSNRTYVMWDLTPSNHTDQAFDLRFDSGVTHRFNGSLASVYDASGMSLDVATTAIPGASITLASAATDAKYNVALTWGSGRPTNIVYSSKESAGAIAVAVGIDSNGFITALTKHDPTNGQRQVSLSGTTITGPWGTVKRERTGSTVTITSTITASGSFVETYTLNDKNRITQRTLAANGDTSTTEWEYYDTAEGRYQSGLLKNSRLKKITMPNSSTIEYTYDDNTGWLIKEDVPVGNGSSRYACYGYTHAGDTTANPTNLFERPRVVTNLFGSTVIGKTLLAYTGYSQETVQICTNATAAWNDPGNLTSVTLYSTNGLLAGLPTNSVTPTLTNAMSYQISGLSGSVFTAIGKLSVSESYSTGETITNVVNAFGAEETLLVVESNVVVESAVSTVDAFGRILKTTYLDGTSVSNSNWGWHGPTSVRDIDGSVSALEYFETGFEKKLTDGATGRISDYLYDPLGNPVKETITGNGGSLYSIYMTYDSQSRPTYYRDRVNKINMAYAAMEYGLLSTVTYSGEDATRVLYQGNFKDGSLRHLAGTACAEHRDYEYGVADGMYYEKEIKPADDVFSDDEWICTYYNMLGIPTRIEASGVTPGEVTTVFMDDQGRPVGLEDEEGVTRLWSYGAKNTVETSGIDADANGVLDEAGSDRMVKDAQIVSASGILRRSLVYRRDSDSSTEAITESLASLSGNQLAEAIAGRTNISSRSAFSSGGVYSITNTSGTGAKTVFSYDKWLLNQVEQYAAGAATPWRTQTFNYDDLGALASMEDSRNGTTTFQYDSKGRLWKIFLPDTGKAPVIYSYYEDTEFVSRLQFPDGKSVRFDYYGSGLLKRRYDEASYDVEFEYDLQSRLKTMTTEREGTVVETEWAYDPETGLLQSKIIDGVASETYTYLDNGFISTVEDANGIVVSNSYSTAGELSGVTFSSGSNAPITAAMNRLGLPYATGQGLFTNYYVYALDGLVLTNLVSGSGLVPDAQFAYSYAEQHPGLTAVSFAGGGQSISQTAAYNTRDLVSALSNGTVAVSYGYETNAALITSCAYSVAGSPVMQKTVQWDSANDRITNITYTANGSNVAGYAYSYYPNSDRIYRITLLDGSYWEYTYDARRHLLSGKRFLSDGTPFHGMQFGAEYDSIGNAVRNGPVLAGGVPAETFTSSDLNIFVARIWSNQVEMIGSAVTNAAVTVNGQPALRNEEWFRSVLLLDNASSAVQTNITAEAAWYNSAINSDVVAVVSGSLYVACTTESPDYDGRASITNESRFTYRFDAFGRLEEVASKNLTPALREEYDYFADGRRAVKRVYENGSNVQTHTFLYDRWNLVQEQITNHVVGTLVTKQYVWGLDLIGQRNGSLDQASGGIGGLLAVRTISGSTTNLYLPVADHNGNIHQVVDASTKQVVAEYQYSPFGVLVGEWGTAADVCPLRFQSKYYDKATELYYFGYRYYHASSAKWLTRDPMEEQGGINLTEFCSGDPINSVDSFGGMPVTLGQSRDEGEAAAAQDPFVLGPELSDSGSSKSSPGFWRTMLYTLFRPVHAWPTELQTEYYRAQANDARAAEAQGQWWNSLSGREKFLTYVPMAYPLNEAMEKFAGGDSAGEVGEQVIHAGVEGAMFALMCKAMPGGARGEAPAIQRQVALVRSPVNAQIGSGNAWGWIADKYRGVRLRGWTRQAVRDVDVAIAKGDRVALRAMGAGRRESGRLISGRDIRGMFRGQVIHTRAQQLATSRLGFSRITFTERGAYGPDIYNPITMRAWDITTRSGWARHVERYVVSPPVNPRTQVLRPIWRQILPLVY